MKRLVIALLVLAGLLVAADFGAAAVTESVVSRQMRSQLGLVDDPSVRINGFPFLTQAVAGEYGSVDINADRISVGQMREVGVRAQLRNVSAPPLATLIGSGLTTLQAKAAEGTVRIPANDVQRLLPGVVKLRIESLDDGAIEQAIDDGADVTLGDINPNLAVRLVGTSPLLGTQAEVSVIAALELADGQIRIVPRDIRLGGGAPALPAAIQQQLRQLFTLRIDPGSLPLDVTPTKLRAVDDGLEISGRARDLTLGGPATSTGG